MRVGLNSFGSQPREVGKRHRRSLNGAGHPGRKKFLIRDNNSGKDYLVDTGACASVIPATEHDRRCQEGEAFGNASGGGIKTYGTRQIPLHFGNGHYFTQTFTIADVTQPILGFDFFENNRLKIDVEDRLLEYKEDGRTICSIVPDEFQEILAKYPQLFVQNFDSLENKHGIQHYIETKGPPVFSRPRRLDGDKLEAAKKEFAELEKLGIIRRSKSPWSSPLHVVPKANGKLRPCGDYRRLNEMTVDDKYCLPHIQDFNRNLLGATIFSKIDLQRGYHQIPVHPDHVPKTAICTPFGLFEYVRMPFGLKNAAQAFQRMMDQILAGLPFGRSKRREQNQVRTMYFAIT